MSDYLDSTVTLPLEDIPNELQHSFRRIVGKIERYLEDIHREINGIIITTGQSGIIYFGIPNDVGIYAEGIIRVDTTSGTFKVEKSDGTGNWEQIFEAAY